ncbi:efflux RND transporter periplasmic adaptor subunit [Candidatus Uabimicrobium sp. HlEnr_7]|uniref:efflux RND transporter periplasmic adaptor subunit n=1 Tax=Candidatus Uabimicrobium helgolandensis TaxID=3095367 RepID=UPI0035588BB2
MSNEIAHQQSLSVNPLEIQSTVLQIFENYHQQEDFYRTLLDFISVLTNARGALLCEIINKEVNLSIKKLLEPENKHWQLVCTAIKKSVKNSKKNRNVVIGNLSLASRKWRFILAPIMGTNKFLCLVVEIEKEEQLTPFILILQLIATYVPFMQIGKDAQKKEKIADRVGVAIELIHGAICEGELYKSAQNIVEKIQRHLKCQRIAMGFVKTFKTKLVVMSDGETFDKRSSLVKKIEAAMEEAVREKKTIFYPLPDEDRTLQLDVAHKDLKIQANSDHIITVPMFNHKEQAIAVWIFMWEDTAPQQEDMNLIEAVTPHVAEVMSLLKKTRANILVRGARYCGTFVRKLRTWVFVATFVAVLWLVQLPWAHHIRAKCQVVPTTRYTISAPFAGILRTSHCKPGDLIQKNQLLATLDDRELQIEYIATEQSLAAITKKMSLLFAEEKMADYHITRVEKKKIIQRLKLLKYRLQHLEIRSPNSGVLLQGDLDKFIGTPVSVGEVLFEVAPVDKLLVESYVDEKDVSFLELESSVELRVDAYPEKSWESSLKYMSPISEVKDGNNVFVCEMALANDQKQLLPGMSGEVRILAGKQPIWWLWLHRPLSWIKTKMWW